MLHWCNLNSLHGALKDRSQMHCENVNFTELSIFYLEKLFFEPTAV
jgi:hypothetical protein